MDADVPLFNVFIPRHSSPLPLNIWSHSRGDLLLSLILRQWSQRNSSRSNLHKVNLLLNSISTRLKSQKNDNEMISMIQLRTIYCYHLARRTMSISIDTASSDENYLPLSSFFLSLSFKIRDIADATGGESKAFNTAAVCKRKRDSSSSINLS